MKKRHKTTIFQRIFFPFLLVVVLQIAVMSIIFIKRGLFKNLNENALGLLQECTQNRQQILLNKMLMDWTDFENLEETMNDIVERQLAFREKDWSDIKTDPELNAKIVSVAAPELIKQLRSNKTTGIFLILDGMGIKNEPQSYAGVYIRDTDPNSNNNDNSDLMMFRGLPPLSRELGLSLDSFWKPGFSFEGGADNEENRSFFNPLNEAKRNKLIDSKYSGYWCDNTYISDDTSVPAVTYSIPLISRDGHVYGVIGVEITKSYLFSFINSSKNVLNSDFFYYLGVTKDGGKTYKKVISTAYKDYQDEIEAEVFENTNIGDLIKIKNDNGMGDLYGAAIKLHIYNNNTAFSNEEWSLIGMGYSNLLFEATRQFRQMLIISALITMVAGSVIAMAASRGIVRPITSLVEYIRKNRDHYSFKLEHTKINEIDQLSDALTEMNREITEAAMRTSKLIELSGMPIGVYEIRKDIEEAYCSDGFFKLLDCMEYKNDNNLVPVDILKKVLDKAIEYKTDKNIYKLKSGDRYIYARIVTQEFARSTVSAILDVTSEVEEKHRIERERDFDSLTGIWNRRAFENRITDLFENHKDELKIGALVMFDLDNLKSINDAYGHDCGDMYIRKFAEAIRSFADEKTILARRSGDEFYILMYGSVDRDEIRKKIRACWEYATSQNLELPDHKTCKIRVSGGVAWYPHDSDQVSQIIHFADFALYRAKNIQKGSVQEFDINEYREDSFMFNGHAALNKLIEEQLIKFMYQPIVSVHTGKIYGYEMLMRGAVEELRTPDTILKLAKDQGKLYYIEKLTWLKGLADTKKMFAENKLVKGARIFINSIANQMLTASDSQIIETQFSDLMQQIVLEVTESEGNNLEYTHSKMEFIKKNNAMIAIDDYGTGYNSELALVEIPSDIVKIDISFVRDVDKNKDKQQLIKNLISFARRRNIAVLAEGIETKEEMMTLIGFGIDYMQGYYIAKPQYEPADLTEEQTKEILSCVSKE